MRLIVLNCCGFIGVAFGIAIGNMDEEVNHYASLFISGAFLYIGLGQMLPIVQRTLEDESNFSSAKQRSMVNWCSTLFFIFGILIMYGITFLE